MLSLERSSGIALWVSWTLATIAAGGIAIALSIWLIGSISTSLFGLLVTTLAIGFMSVILQGCLLKRYIPDLVFWEWAAYISFGLIPGWLVVDGMVAVGGVMEFNHSMPAIVVEAVGGAIFGVLLGGAEWIFLRPYRRGSIFRVSAGLIWIILSGIAWASGFAIYRSIIRGNAMLSRTGELELKQVHSVGWLMAVIVVAVITGFALTIVLERNSMRTDLHITTDSA